MSLRARITLLVSVTVALLVVLVGLGAQLVVARTLVEEIDRDLAATARTIVGDPTDAEPSDLEERDGPSGSRRPPLRRDRFGGAPGVVQFVAVDGRTVRPDGSDDVVLPVDARVLAVAVGDEPAYFSIVRVEGRALRMLTTPSVDGVAVQVARPLREVTSVTRLVRRRTILLTLLGAALGAAGAWLIAGRSLRPLTHLTTEVESIRGDRDLTRRVGSSGDDEVGRLARAFDDLLARLEAARGARDRLIADASHELRTPITSLRTNLEVLVLDDVGMLAPAERARLVEDVIGQLDELTTMIDGLVRAARAEASDGRRVLVGIATLVTDVIERARRRHPQRRADLRALVGDDAATTRVLVDPDRMPMALSELIDNAVKHAPEGTIELAVTTAPLGDGRDGVRLAVLDRGAGVDPDDLARLFDRFHRTAEARAVAGSGLGLAMVRAVAEAHGGRADARLRAGRGLDVGLTLPLARP